MTHQVASYTLEFSLTVEYSLKDGSRVSKTFDDPLEARRFYAAKFKAGAEPKIIDGARVN